MTNKEIYDQFTAELFSELYSNHPVPISRNLDSDTPDRNVKMETKRFLSENNYVLFDEMMGGDYDDIRFADRGLALLEMPDETSGTVGKSLVAAIKDGAVSVTASIVSHIMISGATH